MEFYAHMSYGLLFPLFYFFWSSKQLPVGMFVCFSFPKGFPAFSKGFPGQVYKRLPRTGPQGCPSEWLSGTVTSLTCRHLSIQVVEGLGIFSNSFLTCKKKREREEITSPECPICSAFLWSRRNIKGLLGAPLQRLAISQRIEVPSTCRRFDLWRRFFFNLFIGLRLRG